MSNIDDFFNPNTKYLDYIEGGRRPNNVPRENKPFAYPSNRRHNISDLNRKGLQPLNQRIVRGFMRSIVYGGDVGAVLDPTSTTRSNFRLNFQFNPEYIERKVSQSPGAVNPLLQDPAALTQGVPGTASFNFTMLFNREREVAAYEGTEGLVGLTVDNFADDIDQYYSDPGRVGVMHDLAIFDKIIGQGISKELIDTLTAYTQRQSQEAIDLQKRQQENGTITEEDTIRLIQPSEVDKTLRGDQVLYQNIGNSAFINPMPVRIVFSDLFMVEGLVVASAVAFQKFSENMVPTVCQVNCEVYALYFGFAQKKSFLTKNLTTWAQEEGSNIQQAVVESQASAKNIIKNLGTFSIAFNKNLNNNMSVARVPSKSTNAAKTLLSSGDPFLTVSSVNYDTNSNSAKADVVTAVQWHNAARLSTSGVEAKKDNVSVTTEIKNALFSSVPSSSETGPIPITCFFEYVGEPDENLTEIKLINMNLVNKTRSAIAPLSVEGSFEVDSWKRLTIQDVIRELQPVNPNTITNNGDVITTVPELHFGRNVRNTIMYSNTFFISFQTPFTRGRPNEVWQVSDSVFLQYQVQIAASSTVGSSTQLAYRTSQATLTVPFPGRVGQSGVLYLATDISSGSSFNGYIVKTTKPFVGYREDSVR